MKSRILHYAPKWLCWLIAKLFRYRWGTCPICGRAFASFEASPVYLYETIERDGEDLSGSGMGRMVCSSCANEADELNRQNFGISRVSDTEFSMEWFPATPGAHVKRFGDGEEHGQ